MELSDHLFVLLCKLGVLLEILRAQINATQVLVGESGPNVPRVSFSALFLL